MRVLAVGVLLLSGCVSVDSYTAPDGRKAYVIACNGGLQSMAACMNKAAELCAGPYEVLNKDQTMAPIGTMSNGVGSIVPAKFRSLEVSCGA